MIPKSLIGNDALIALVAAAYAAPPGDFVEVGVFQGGSAWWLAGKARITF